METDPPYRLYARFAYMKLRRNEKILILKCFNHHDEGQDYRKFVLRSDGDKTFRLVNEARKYAFVFIYQGGGTSSQGHHVVLKFVPSAGMNGSIVFQPCIT